MYHTTFLLGDDNKNKSRAFPAWPCNKEFYFFQKLSSFSAVLSNIVSIIHVFDF